MPTEITEITEITGVAETINKTGSKVINSLSDFMPDFLPDFILSNLFETILLLSIVFLIKTFVTKQIGRNKSLSLEAKRKWEINTRNLSIAFFALCAFFIWGSQMRQFAFSVAAVAVACVMIFKEMITNFMGGIARMISSPFNIGDRIAIGNFRGDVIDMSMMTTTILEVGPGHHIHQFTGSRLTIPNSLLLNTVAVNETAMQEYTLHVFQVVLMRNDDWRKSEKILLEASNVICAPYFNKAKQYIDDYARKLALDAPVTEPRIMMLLDDPEEIKIFIRLPVPTRRKGRIEQEVLRRYLDALDKGDEKHTKGKAEIKAEEPKSILDSKFTFDIPTAYVDPSKVAPTSLTSTSENEPKKDDKS